MESEGFYYNRVEDLPEVICMFDKIFNSPTQTMLNQALDGSALRNQVLANNIANVDTPGFKRSEVLFEEAN